MPAEHIARERSKNAKMVSRWAVEIILRVGPVSWFVVGEGRPTYRSWFQVGREYSTSKLEYVPTVGWLLRRQGRERILGRSQHRLPTVWLKTLKTRLPDQLCRHLSLAF